MLQAFVFHVNSSKAATCYKTQAKVDNFIQIPVIWMTTEEL